MKVAEIQWSYPRVFESAILTELSQVGWGLYYISRKFGDNETLLYIGLTFDQNFKSRLKSHLNTWMSDYRGTKYIRFGEFIKPRTITKDIIEDVESCFIYELDPVQNKNKTATYSYTNEYKVISSGYRGVIPTEISMKEH